MNFRGNSYGPMALSPYFQGNSYGPMALKVRLKLPLKLVLVHGWLFPERVRAKVWVKFAIWRGEVWGEVFGEVFGLVSLGKKLQRELQPKIPKALHSKTGFMTRISKGDPRQDKLQTSNKELQSLTVCNRRAGRTGNVRLDLPFEHDSKQNNCNDVWLVLDVAVITSFARNVIVLQVSFLLLVRT